MRPLHLPARIALRILAAEEIVAVMQRAVMPETAAAMVAGVVVAVEEIRSVWKKM